LAEKALGLKGSVGDTESARLLDEEAVAAAASLHTRQVMTRVASVRSDFTALTLVADVLNSGAHPYLYINRSEYYFDDMQDE
jgi:hypothetical protein